MDSVIRTFDIPTGKLIDAFRPASVATSISFSPTGDFLATAHVDSVGVFLWYPFGSSSVFVGDLIIVVFFSGQTEHNIQMFPCRV